MSELEVALIGCGGMMGDPCPSRFQVVVGERFPTVPYRRLR
jgi:hypothetical protein